MEESDTGSEQHFHFLVHKSFNEEPEKTQKNLKKKKKKIIDYQSTITDCL